MSNLGEVDLTPFREAFARSPEPLAVIAERMGADEAQVSRLLTARVHTCRGYRRRGFARCRYRTALRLADAMGLDPVEVGL